MAANRTVSVYVDDDPGGDAASYTSMQAMETAEDGDITGVGGWLQVNVVDDWSGGADGRTVFTGWTCDYGSDEFINIYVTSAEARNPYTDGKYSTSYYCLESDAISTIEIDGNDPNEFSAVFDGIQAKTTGSGSERSLYITNDSGIGTVKFLNSYVWELADGASPYALIAQYAGGTIHLINCIIQTVAGAKDCINVNAANTVLIYNCTITEAGEDAIESNGCTITVKNCAIFNNPDDFQDAFTTCTHNACDDDTGETTSDRVDLNENASGEWTAAFTDYTTDDFRVKDAGSALYQVGITNEDDANVPTTDIAGNARVTGTGLNCDIGAFELVAAAAGTENSISFYRTMMAQLSGSGGCSGIPMMVTEWLKKLFKPLWRLVYEGS